MAHKSCFAMDWSDALASQTLRDRLTRDGVVLVRNVIDRADISRLAAIVENHFAHAGRRFGLGQTQPDAGRFVTGLELAITHPNIIALFEAILGRGQPVFTGHCDIHRNMLSGWHKDTGSTYNAYLGDECFAADDCRIYKLGLYLQDQEDSHGLRGTNFMRY